MGKSKQQKRNSKEKRIKLTKEEIDEFLQTVRDDLLFLKNQNYVNPSCMDVRISSSILRRLLHEGMYHVAWNIAGLPECPNIESEDLAEAISEIDPRYIQYGYAGGSRIKVPGYMTLLLIIPKEELDSEGGEATVRQISKLYKPIKRRLFTLPEFCQSPSAVCGHSTVSRLRVIRYVANKLWCTLG